MQHPDKKDRQRLLRALAAAICAIPKEKAILLIVEKG